jgi:hypothetical protein
MRNLVIGDRDAGQSGNTTNGDSVDRQGLHPFGLKPAYSRAVPPGKVTGLMSAVRANH